MDIFFFQAEDGIRDHAQSRGLGDVYKRQEYMGIPTKTEMQTAVNPRTVWKADSWRSFHIVQQPQYNDPTLLKKQTDTVRKLPGIVSPSQILSLREKLVEVGRGKRFYLQMGDCAESFDDCEASIIEQKIGALEKVGELLQTIRKVPVLKIARIAGQYAKPRSDTHEIVNGEKVLVYRGDIVDYNDPSKRDADPARIQEAYLRSVATFNHIKNRDLALTGSDLSDKDKSGPIFTSHEALLLEYEEALVREYENEFYATSGHFLWIGERTRQIDGAHVEFFRGLKNPIGVKLGPTISALELRELLKILNPNNEEGKIVLITRMGVSKIEAALPPLIQEVKNNNHNVIWVCDPMHGNTVKINGYKTRKVQDLTDELLHSIRIFKENGLSLQGIHFESSPFEVTECIGGKTKVIEEVHLPLCYTTLCDPRLNLPQCLDIVEAISTAFQS
eukprot:TRINITY_DN3059_c0_g1_i2.p1 TRINITY_DN3059_c0_g1~~TRINITY_DN3059_c0_g1_i2.p1  ORF type:complete len:446 (-),score=102.38 TRINITY_DN3059_c0_g1_i2:141-1478(-)